METREILFRAISGDTGNWEYGSVHTFEELAVIVNKKGNNLSQLNAVKKHTVGQYTGLTDRNGVRIFEGDRVKDSDFAYRVRFGPFQMDEWQIIGFWLEHENPKYSGPLGSDDSKVLEVVGHIHDSSKIWL